MTGAATERWVMPFDELRRVRGPERARPEYVTTDGRFTVRKSRLGPWGGWAWESVVNDPEDDLALEALRGCPALYRTFGDAQLWLFGSVYSVLRGEG